MIRSKYVQVLLNQDMSFFDTYGNNGDIVSQVLSDVLLIQSALSEKVSFLCKLLHAEITFSLCLGLQKFLVHGIEISYFIRNDTFST